MIVRLFLDLHFVCFTFLAYELSGSLINLPYNCLKIIFLSVINLLFDLIILRLTKALKLGLLAQKECMLAIIIAIEISLL